MPRKNEAKRRIDEKPDSVVAGNDLIGSVLPTVGPAIGSQPGPTNLQVVSNQIMQSAVTPMALVGLTWDAPPGQPVLSYLVECATDSGFTTGLVRRTAYQASASVELPTGTLYYIHVQAINAYVTSAFSAAVSVTTAVDTSPPAVPTSIAANFNAAGDLLITWTNPTSANFRDVEVSIYADSGFTTLLSRSYSAVQMVLWTAAQNRQAGGGTPDPAVFVRMASRSWGGVLSSFVTPGTQPVKAVPANVTGLLTSWLADTGAAGPDLVISWAASSGASAYQLTIDTVTRTVTDLRYTYTLDTNRSEHSATPDPSVAISIVGVDGLDQVSATPTTTTATNAAPPAPTGVTLTGFFSTLSIGVGSALPADGLTYRYRLIQTSPSAADITWDSPSPLQTRAIAVAATYQVGVKAVDVFGQAGAETLSAAVTSDALTLADLRSASRYSDSLSSSPATLKATLSDGVLTGSGGGGGGSYAAAAWTQGSASLAPDYYTALPSYERQLTDVASSSSSTAFANQYRTSGPYIETGPFEVVSGKIRLIGGAATAKVRIVVGLWTSGAPAAPLGASTEFSVAATTEADYAFTFGTPVQFTGSGDVQFYLGVWTDTQHTIRTIAPATGYDPGIVVNRSDTATYSTAGAPPAPTTSMTAGGATTTLREFAAYLLIRPTALAQVTGLTASATGTAITLSWTAVSRAQRYRIERDTGGGFSTIAKVTGTSYVDRGLPVSTSCTYRVRAEQRNQSGTVSATASATTGAGVAADTQQVLSQGAWTGGSINPNNVGAGWAPAYASGGPTYRMPSNYRAPVEDARGGIYVNWNQIQSTASSSTFDWTLIDNALADAASRGARMTIQARAFVPGAGNICPPFITSGMGSTVSGDFVPTWNNATVRSTWRAFVLAMGARYDTDARVHAVSAGYGQYGERILTGVYSGLAPDATTAAAYDQDLIDAFANKTIMLATGGPEGRTSLDTKIATYQRVVIRSNAWGQDTAHRNVYMHGTPSARRAIRDKALPGGAPMMDETIAAPTSTEIQRAAAVMSDALAGPVVPWGMMSERNFSNYASYGATDQTAFDTITANLGFRLRLEAVQTAARIASGVATTITAAWTLSGRTSIYDNYTVRWQLRSGSTLVDEELSTIDLRTLHPLGSGNSVTWQDNVTFAVAGGTYTLGVQITPPSGDPSPALLLAQTGVQTGNWYSLGTIIVDASGAAIAYPTSATWSRWVRYERDLLERYRTVTLAMAAVSGTSSWYLRTSQDGSTWRYFAGPLTSGRIVTEVASASAAQAAAVSAATLGSSTAARVDLPSAIEARYVELWLRNTADTTNLAEYYPRRLVQSDDIEAESIKAINIAAGSITADRLSVTQLSAIAADLGTVTAGTITGATIQTGVSNPRVVLDSANGIRSFDSGGTLQVQIRTSDGALTFGAGQGTLDKNGLSMLRTNTNIAGYSSTNAVSWKDGSGNVSAWQALNLSNTAFTQQLTLRNVNPGAGLGSAYGITTKLIAEATNGGNTAELWLTGGGYTSSPSELLLQADAVRLAGPLYQNSQPFYATRSGGSAVWGLDGTTEGAALSITNGGTATPFGNANNFSGLFIINPTTVNGTTAVVICGGASISIVGVSQANVYTTTAGTASRINVYLVSNVVTIQNNLGSTISINVLAFRTRNSQ